MWEDCSVFNLLGQSVHAVFGVKVNEIMQEVGVLFHTPAHLKKKAGLEFMLQTSNCGCKKYIQYNLQLLITYKYRRIT